MTTAEHRALIRASEYSIRILAQGTVKATGQRFFITTSRDGQGQHIVRLVDGARLACDCQAGRRGLVCCHRARVHEALVDEANRALTSPAGWVPAMAPELDPDEAHEATCRCPECGASIREVAGDPDPSATAAAWC